MRDMDRVRVRITVRVKVRVTNRFRLRLTARDCRYCKPYRPIIMVPTAYRYCIQEIFNMAIESHETESWTLNSRITISYCVSIIIDDLRKADAIRTASFARSRVYSHSM